MSDKGPVTSDQRKDGGPAFPCPVGHIQCFHPEGMSLRDYFAASALSGLLASGEAQNFLADLGDGGHHAHYVPRIAWAIADDMLAAREKEPGE